MKKRIKKQKSSMNTLKDELFIELMSTINMGLKELIRWKNCSLKKLGGTKNLNRLIILLKRPRSKWEIRHFKWAKDIIKLIRKNKNKKSKLCQIKLMNCGFDVTKKSR